MSDSLGVFVLRRTAGAIVVSVCVVAITFLVLHGLAPELARDTEPLPLALLHYLERVFLHADLGRSTFRPGGEVLDLLFRGVGADISLMVGGMAVGLALGTVGGVICVRRSGTWVARGLQGVAAVLLCAPVYVTGMMVILVFAPSIDPPLPFWLVTVNTYTGPGENPGTWLHALIVPWFIAGAPLAAMCLRMVRATLPAVMDAEFVQTAYGKGLRPQRVTIRHALPVALPATLSLAGAYTPLLLGNVVLVEAVFGIPGVYKLVPGAIDNSNLPVLQGIVIVGSVFVVVANALVDVAIAALDPRVRA